MKKTKKSDWKKGTEVEFHPTPASLALYTSAPRPGARGSVVAIPVGGREVTLLPGPGGGMLYVEWKGLGVMGVSPRDVQMISASTRSKSLKRNPAKINDRSADPTVVQYAMQYIYKGKSPSAAAAATAKKLSGSENMFLGYGSGPVFIDPQRLEEAVWSSMVDNAKALIGKLKEGKEHFALDAAVESIKKPAPVRAELKRRVIASMGMDPFRGDDAGEQPKAKRNPVASPAPGAGKRHLPVLSPEWRKERSARILKRNPGGSRNDPQGMRALLLQAIAKPNPAAIRENVNLSTRMMIPQLALEAESLETNLCSIDPMEYYEAFIRAGTSPDTAAARLEEMASWGVTDKV